MRNEYIEASGRIAYQHAEPSDLRHIGRSAFRRMLFDMAVIRAFEQRLLDCAGRGEVSGPVHTSIGQEGVAVAVCRHLRDGDQVVGNHRSHHHFLAQGLARTAGDDAWDPLTESPSAAAHELLTSAFAEILGRPTGVNHGVGGSMHLRHAKIGFMGSSAIVGGGIPIATGLAFANRLRDDDACAVCFIGDGAVNQGTFHETANLAGVLHLPLLIVVENNGYAEATRPEEASAVLPLATQGLAHGLRAAAVKGGDHAALCRTAEDFLSSMRRGAGPALIEVETYRHLDHTGSERGSAVGYRSPAEEDAWRELDPMASLPRTLAAQGLLTADEDEAIREAAAAFVERAFDGMPAPSAVAPVLDTRTLLRGPAQTAPEEAPEGPDEQAPRTKWTFRNAIAEGIARALRESSDVVFLGEEVANPGGLLWQAGRLDRSLVGSRIVNMPISEAGFVGMSGGAAMAGVRPIVELMYGSFALIAADQLFNHIGMIRALYGNTAQAPVIVRAKVPIGRGYGPQHGLNPSGLFTSFPGWRVHAPADPRDYLGTLNSALRCDDPVLLIEFASLYDEVFELSEGDFRSRQPLEGARVVREGDDVSVFSYGIGVSWARAAADELAAAGCSAEVVDLRALDTLSTDWATLESSLARTGHGLFVDPAARGQSIAPRLIADLVGRQGRRPHLSYIACADVQPVTPVLERQAVIGTADIVTAVHELIKAH
ncbi:thiamine pyrophosphate-dependent enzyme [Streptomyces sp. NPDC052023]|uniref:alpha-ketoacid dehydrogenase subunit alpha/beta n=1 Tax=Streptomyces sp. NPDC052023 TaxID=3365681 RepID=UPI0037D30702